MILEVKFYFMTLKELWKIIIWKFLFLDFEKYGNLGLFCEENGLRKWLWNIYKSIDLFLKRHCTDLIIKALCFDCKFLSTQRDFVLILICASLRTYPVGVHLWIVISSLARWQYSMYKLSLANNTFSNVGK
jgi:hypothetical protein